MEISSFLSPPLLNPLSEKPHYGNDGEGANRMGGRTEQESGRLKKPPKLQAQVPATEPHSYKPTPLIHHQGSQSQHDPTKSTGLSS